jgi:hypothetical protein
LIPIPIRPRPTRHHHKLLPHTKNKPHPKRRGLSMV